MVSVVQLLGNQTVSIAQSVPPMASSAEREEDKIKDITLEHLKCGGDRLKALLKQTFITIFPLRIFLRLQDQSHSAHL